MTLEIDQGGRGGDDNDNNNDIQPLVRDASDGKGLQKPSLFAILRQQTKSRPGLVRGIGVGLFMLFFVSTLRGGGTDAASQTHQALHHPPVSIEDLVTKFENAKTIMLEKLKVDYGADNFKNMFFDDDGTCRGRSAFISPTQTNASWDRIKRKMTMKVLEHMRGHEASFVWATGGHSAAASHGNFFNQSYTWYMENDVKDVFGALGLGFIGKNYAVGGMSSSPEVGLCQQSIFGLDFDVLSWDYGMTDGNKILFMDHYFHRAVTSANRPAVVAFSGRDSGRTNAMAEMEGKGAAVLILDYLKEKELIKSIPETFGMTSEQIDQLPLFVKNLKCNGRIEEGEPFCDADKFDNTMCVNRKFRTSWHPGWRWHAVRGRFMSLLMIELLSDALNDIQGSAVTPAELLEELKSQDDSDYEKLLNSDLPSTSRQWVLRNYTGPYLERWRDLLFKDARICHTALLPADIRYKGILTESGPIDPLEWENQPVELQSGNISEVPNNGTTIRLVAEMSERQYCPIVPNIDHKDYFYIGHGEDWKELVLPNEREMETYLESKQSLQGYISVCFVRCDWGKCADGNIINGLKEDLASMQVNEEPVVDMVNFGLEEGNEAFECHMLLNKDGMKFISNDEGRFVIRALVKAEKNYMRFSSFVIW